MKLQIDPSEILTEWITPPENGGQTVTVDYARTDDFILRRTTDRGTGATEIVAHLFPSAGLFEPWNATPRLGRRVGVVSIG